MTVVGCRDGQGRHGGQVGLRESRQASVADVEGCSCEVHFNDKRNDSPTTRYRPYAREAQDLKERKNLVKKSQVESILITCMFFCVILGKRLGSYNEVVEQTAGTGAGAGKSTSRGGLRPDTLLPHEHCHVTWGSPSILFLVYSLSNDWKEATNALARGRQKTEFSSICCLQTHFIGRRDIDGNGYSDPGNSPPTPNNQTSSTMFTYSPLRREKRETRVFRFNPPRQSGSDRISFELGHASLDDDSLQYRALSYVWGDTKDKEDIDVNSEQFSVGANLHALLQMLQHHDVQSWLWGDAICIHQSDDDEKSWHVQTMCDIFKNAEFVYSWLGPGSEATDVAMNFFSDWGPRALKVGVMEKLWPTNMPMNWFCLPRYEVSRFLYYLEWWYFSPEPVFEKGGTVDNALSIALSMDCERYEMARFFYDLLHLKELRGTREKSVLNDLETGITYLLTNEYWHRIWIFQEVALAREVLLMCGEKFTPISSFEAMVEALWKFCGGFPLFFKDFPLRHGFCERFPPHLYPNKAIRVRQLLCRRMKLSLGTILLAFSNQTERPWYRATDPRDIVYGILGLLSNDDRRPFGHVDYKNTTWVHLFTRATRYLIKAPLTSMLYEGKRVYTIGHCLPRPRDQTSELPSWVPDWRDVGVKGLPQSLVDSGSSLQNASDRWVIPYPIVFGHENLSAIQLPGYRVDFVTDVMQYDYHAGNVREGDRPSDWLACIRDFTKLPESSDIWNLEGEDYVWRLIMICHDVDYLWLRVRDFSCKIDAACSIRRLMRQDYPDPQTLPDFLARSIRASTGFKALTKTRTSKHMNDAPITKFSNLNDDTSRDATIVVDRQAQTKSNSVDPERLPDSNSISESDLRSFMDAEIRVLFCRSRSRNSMLFKTDKGMLGIGIGDVRSGDMVVILQNAHVPFILRPRPQDGDGIATNSGGSGSTFTFGGEVWVDGIMKGEFMATNPKEEVFDIYWCILAYLVFFLYSSVPHRPFPTNISRSIMRYELHVFLLHGSNGPNNRNVSSRRTRTENVRLKDGFSKDQTSSSGSMKQPSP